MIRNPDETRRNILRKSGVLFNRRGYKATSISDITKATGYTKGAIYRHFDSKAKLEKATLNHLSAIVFSSLRERIRSVDTAIQKLTAVLDFFESYVTDPVVPGGCPLMNAAIEADDANPTLRREARKVLDVIQQSVIAILANGIRHKQLRRDIDKDFYATIIIASMEGAIMMSKLRGNNDDIRKVVRHLREQIQNLATRTKLSRRYQMVS